jgi:hypothetical protein
MLVIRTMNRQQTRGSRGQMLPALVSSSLALNLKPDSPHYLFVNRRALSRFLCTVIPRRCIVIEMLDGRAHCLWNRLLNEERTCFYETDF